MPTASLGDLRIDQGYAFEPITDELRARIWVLVEEGCSFREIRKQTGCDYYTIQRVRAEDPERLRELIAAKQEERAALWKQIEHQAISLQGKFLGGAERLFFGDDGKVRDDRQDKFAEFGARWLSAVQRSASDATTKHQLLTGGATERIDNGPALEPGSDEYLINLAIQFGEDGIRDLPAALRERARARLGGKPTE